MAKPKRTQPFLCIYVGENVLLTDVKFKLANEIPRTDNFFRYA